MGDESIPARIRLKSRGWECRKCKALYEFDELVEPPDWCERCSGSVFDINAEILPYNRGE